MLALKAQPRDRKVFQVLMCILFLLGFLKFVGLSIFGIVFGILLFVLAVWGLAGSWFNRKRWLFFFLIGMGVLFVVEVGYFVVNEITYSSSETQGSDKTNALFSMILSVFMIAYYVACLYFGYKIWKA